MKRVRVAVLGYGHLGKWHCQKVAAHSEVAEFVAIVEKFPVGQDAARVNHPNVKVVADIKEIIQDIDAAFVVTPTSTHFELVSYLLGMGKHVFCEKPVCSNDAEAVTLRELAKNKNLVIQVGHSERFHEAWDLLLEKFRSLPTPYTIRINRVAPFKGRATDVDVVQDLAIHDLDLVLHLFKERPRSITAHGYRVRTKNYDHASLILELEKGCEVHIVVGRNSTREVRELEVISSAGMISVDLFANKVFEATNGQFEDGTFVRESAYSKRDHLLIEHKYFYDSILRDVGPIIGLKDGVNAVHLVDCALKSMELKSKVEVSSLE
jgi:predicted dehydrogenase